MIKYENVSRLVRLDSAGVVVLVVGDTMRQRIKFTDERVCKSHLLESCPHDILSGTVSVSQKLLNILEFLERAKQPSRFEVEHWLYLFAILFSVVVVDGPRKVLKCL